ncbi:hypothetical protein IZY60_03655 [Lutibacter sp. B2]|nr:hypothetical protein [Lutibacter sp. B2]
MNKEIITFLKQINETLKNIDYTLKIIYKKELPDHSTLTKIEKKIENHTIKSEITKDENYILHDWEHEMPYEELMEKYKNNKKI